MHRDATIHLPDLQLAHATTVPKATSSAVAAGAAVTATPEPPTVCSYSYRSEVKTFAEALDSCRAEGGDLASLHSVQDVGAAYTAAGQRDSWIGITRNSTESMVSFTLYPNSSTCDASTPTLGPYTFTVDPVTGSAGACHELPGIEYLTDSTPVPPAPWRLSTPTYVSFDSIVCSESTGAIDVHLTIFSDASCATPLGSQRQHFMNGVCFASPQGSPRGVVRHRSAQRLDVD